MAEEVKIVARTSEFKIFYFVQEESDIQESEQASCRLAESELEHTTHLLSKVWSELTTSRPCPFREDLANPMFSHYFWAAVQMIKNEKLSSYLCVDCRWLPHIRAYIFFFKGL